jgi:Flp pilus assembly protein TadG
MLNTITAITAGLRQFAKNREGAVAIIFGLCAIPAIIAAGMAIDVGRIYMVKIRLGAALDAAALAKGQRLTEPRIS